jgi:hypothetical protein
VGVFTFLARAFSKSVARAGLAAFQAAKVVSIEVEWK